MANEMIERERTEQVVERKIDRTNISGLDKAAIFLLAVGPEAAAPVLGQVDDMGLVALAERMPQIRKIPPKVLEGVLMEFIQMHRGLEFVPTSVDEVHDLLRQAVDPARLRRILESPENVGSIRTPVWAKLARMKPNTIYSLIKEENPQTVAVILGHMAPDLASAVLERYPEEVQQSVIVRMARIETVKTDVTSDIEDALEEQVHQFQGRPGLALDGMEQVVEMLKYLNSTNSKHILDHLKNNDTAMYEQIESQLLVFEDISELSDRDVQELLKHVKSEDLMFALKGTSDELREHIFSNMSQRAADIMREDIEAMGGVKLSDVEASQRAILEVTRDLDSKGIISLDQEEIVY